MSYEIVKSIVVKGATVFTRMSSNNVSPKDFTSIENPGLTKLYNQKGLTELYVNLVKGGLEGNIRFDRNGNKMVKQLNNITETIWCDKKYILKQNKMYECQNQIWKIKEGNEEKEKYKKKFDIYRKELEDYVELKVKEYIQPRLKVTDKIKRELDNVLEMYEENMENEEDDIFSRTEDGYANEMLIQGIFDVLDGENFDKILELNDNLYTYFDVDIDNKDYNEVIEEIRYKLADRIKDNIESLNGIMEAIENEKEEFSIN